MIFSTLKLVHYIVLTTNLLHSFLQIIDSRDFLPSFSRSVTVSKQAFEKAIDSNVNEAFAAVLRFNNMAQVRKIPVISPSLIQLTYMIMLLLCCILPG